VAQAEAYVLERKGLRILTTALMIKSDGVCQNDKLLTFEVHWRSYSLPTAPSAILRLYTGDAEKVRAMNKLLSRLWTEEEGQDLAEYVLLLALLALGAITTIGAIASTINAMFLNEASSLGNASGG